MLTKVAIVGEHEPGYEPQEATVAALQHAACCLKVELDTRWVGSLEVDDEALTAADGVFMSSGPVYRDLDRALRAVHYCLETDTPLTGTCSGFQNTVVALARRAGITDATHEEYGMPGTAVVTRLTCSIAGTVAEIRLEPGSVAGDLYGVERALEEHCCNYGLDPEFASVIDAVGGVISGRGDDGTPRIVELPGHPFFLVALFLPQLSSRPDHAHPLLAGFVAAAAARAAVNAR